MLITAHGCAATLVLTPSYSLGKVLFTGSGKTRQTLGTFALVLFPSRLLSVLLRLEELPGLGGLVATSVLE